LQRHAEDLEYTELLNIAGDLKDSVMRMVYVATFATSKYASATGIFSKPFNPLLGETYEYVNPKKGYRFFAEQVSHHPPKGAVWAESPKWTYYGESLVKFTIHVNLKSFDMTPESSWFLKLRLASGIEEIYTWKKPVMSATLGMIAGSPTVDHYGSMEVKNCTTGEVCFMSGSKMCPADELSGKIVDAQGQTLYRTRGRWNEQISAYMTPHSLIEEPGSNGAHQYSNSNSNQGFVVWESNRRPEATTTNLTPFLITLNDIPDKLQFYLPPTDSRLRPDQRALERREYQFATAEKIRLEENQRKRRRKRDSAGLTYAPRWFKRTRCDVTGEEYWYFDGTYWMEREKRAGEAWEGVEDIFANMIYSE
jgi:hypothetical protein